MHESRYPTVKDLAVGSRRGFSLTEAVIFIAVLCIGGMLGLQLYFGNQARERAAGEPGVRQVDPQTLQAGSLGIASSGTVTESATAAAAETANLMHQTNPAGSSDVVFIDEALPAGAPPETSALEIVFGEGAERITLSVHGTMVQEMMEYGTQGETTPIFVFRPQ